MELEKEGKVVISSLLKTVWADCECGAERDGKEQVMRLTCTKKNMRQAQPSDTNSVVTFSARFMHSPTINLRGGYWAGGGKEWLQWSLSYGGLCSDPTLMGN